MFDKKIKLGLETFFKMFNIRVDWENFIIFLDEIGKGRLEFKEKKINFEINSNALSLKGEGVIEEDKIKICYQIGENIKGEYQFNYQDLRPQIELSYVNNSEFISIWLEKRSFEFDFKENDIFTSYRFLENPFLGIVLNTYFKKRKEEYEEFVRISKNQEALEVFVLKDKKEKVYTLDCDLEILKRGEIMSNQVPSIFLKLQEVGNFFKNEGVSFLNLLSESLSGFNEEEIKSLLGVSEDDSFKVKSYKLERK